MEGWRDGGWSGRGLKRVEGWRVERCRVRSGWRGGGVEGGGVISPVPICYSCVVLF